MSTKTTSGSGVSAHRRTASSLLFVTVVAMGVISGACKTQAQPAIDDSVSLPEGAPRVEIESAAEVLVAALAAQGPVDAVTFDVRDFGDGLYTVRAFQMGSYPGTGNASVVVSADGRTFGVHGEHDLAELVRELGWLASPPLVDRLLRLLDTAYFEGAGATSPTEPALSTSPDGLVLRFERFVPPGPSLPWRATFPTDGPTRLETHDGSSADPEAWIVVTPR